MNISRMLQNEIERENILKIEFAIIYSSLRDCYRDFEAWDTSRLNGNAINILFFEASHVFFGVES